VLKYAAIRLSETCSEAEVYEDTLDVAAGRSIRNQRPFRSRGTLETLPNVLNHLDTRSLLHLITTIGRLMNGGAPSGTAAHGSAAG